MPRLNFDVPVISKAPRTFLVQTEDDDRDGVDQPLVDYAALAKVHAPAGIHRVER